MRDFRLKARLSIASLTALFLAAAAVLLWGHTRIQEVESELVDTSKTLLQNLFDKELTLQLDRMRLETSKFTSSSVGRQILLDSLTDGLEALHAQTRLVDIFDSYVEKNLASSMVLLDHDGATLLVRPDNVSYRSSLQIEQKAARTGEIEAGIELLHSNSPQLSVALPITSDDSHIGTLLIFKNLNFAVQDYAKHTKTTAALFWFTNKEILHAPQWSLEYLRKLNQAESDSLLYKENEFTEVVSTFPVPLAPPGSRMQILSVHSTDPSGTSVDPTQNISFLVAALVFLAAVFGSYRITSIAASNIDDTRINRERQFRSLRRELARTRETRDRLCADLGHQMRTPLHNSLQALELLEESELSAEQDSLVEILHSSFSTLHQTLTRILKTQSFQSRRSKLKPKRFDLLATIEEVVDSLKQSAERRQIDFSLVAVGRLPSTVIGDSAQLKRILSQLINYLLNQVGPNSIILLIVEAETLSHAKLRIHFSLNSPIGIGLDGFKQILDDSLPTKSVSTLESGILLARRLIELLGGNIRIDSSSTGSSSSLTFHIDFDADNRVSQLEASGQDIPFGQSGHTEIFNTEEFMRQHPLAIEPTETSAIPQKPIKPAGRVLIVEDLPINQRITSKLLNKLGYETELAANGLEALKKLEGSEFDLILMDIHMPEMDGIEATRRIRSTEQDDSGGLIDQSSTRIPIIALTAHAFEEDRQMCLQAGMDDFLSKPISGQTLLEVVGKYCKPVLNPINTRKQSDDLSK